MKNLNVNSFGRILLALTMCLSTVAFSQTIEYSKQSCDPIKGRFGLVFGGDQGNITYHAYVENFKTPAPKNFYLTQNRETCKEEQIKLDAIELDGMVGEIIQVKLHDMYAYELIRFIKPSVYISTCQAALVKRNLKTFKVEKFLPFEEPFSVVNLDDMAKINIEEYNEGIVFYTKNQYAAKHTFFIAKYDWELNLVTKKTIDFLKEKNIIASELYLDNKGTAIVEAVVDETREVTFQATKILPSSVYVLVLDQNNESFICKPTINEGVLTGKRNYWYDPNTNQLTGFYFLKGAYKDKKKANPGAGYAYFKWNHNGEATVSQVKMYQYGDVWDDKVSSYLAENKVKKINTTDQFYDALKNDGEVTMRSNGNLVVSYGSLASDGDNSQQHELLSQCKYVYELDQKGSLVWKKFFLASPNMAYKWFKVLPIKDDLYILFKDFDKVEKYFSANRSQTENKNTVGYLAKFNTVSLSFEETQIVKIANGEFYWLNDRSLIDQSLLLTFKVTGGNSTVKIYW